MTKKGLFVTLMTVTFAFFRASAFAEAPVILDPGDVIIGDIEQGANNNVFVFPDAIGLDGLVSDDTEADSLIKWSWTEDGSGASKFLLNGVPALDTVGGGDPINPPLANRIDGHNDDTVATSGTADSDPATVTFRNNDLSPLSTNGGLGPYADPGTTASQILAGETRMITLYASDCSTYSSASITVYTADNTSDSVSGGGAGLTPVLDDDFDGDPSRITGWFGGVLGGNATTGTATGLCMWVQANNTANAGVGWISPPNFAPFPSPPYIPLVDQNVYRIRLTMYCDQTAVGAQPFWTFGYNNLNGGTVTPPTPPPPGGNTYGGDLWVLDVAGGSNGIKGPVNARPNGRDTYDYWFTPNAVLTQQWRGIVDNAESAFATAYDDINDMNLVARVLDGAQGNNSIHNEVDTGTVCVRQLRVDRVNILDLTATPAPLWPAGTAGNTTGGTPAPPITTALFAINPDSFGSGGNGSAAIDNGTNTALFNMGPNILTNGAGGRKSLIFYDPTKITAGDGSQHQPLYPIFWEDDKLLQLAAGIRSGFGGGNGTTEGVDPVDTVFINFDTPTSEIGGFNFTQRSAAGNMFKAASPRLRATTGGSSQTYTSFFYTQNATDIDLNLPGFGFANRIRGYVDFINNNSLGTGADGLDDIIIDSMVLNVIDTNGFN